MVKSKGFISVEILLFLLVMLIIFSQLIEKSFSTKMLIKNYENSIKINLKKNNLREEFLYDFIKESKDLELTSKLVENMYFSKEKFIISYNDLKGAFEVIEKQSSNVNEIHYYDYRIIDNKLLLEKRGYYEYK